MRAVIYARQSLDRNGEGLAVARQLDACRELALANGWTVATEYVDNDVSASAGKPRPEWRKMLADLDDGCFDVLVCWHTDRLYRRVRDLVDLVEIAERRSLRIASVRAADLDLSTPAGRMLAGMLGHAQRYEVEQKSARQVAANAQRASRGRMPWTRRPYGYALADDGSPAVVETEAALLRQAAEDVLGGASLASIVKRWNDAGERTSTGSAWTVTSLRRCLLNPRMSGQVMYRGNLTAQGTWEVILDEETQSRLSAVLRDPRRRVQMSTVRRYPLSGAIVCGLCGGPVYATTADGHGKRYMAYRCRRPHLTRRLDLVDEIVEGAVIGRLSRPDAADLFRADVDVADAQREAVELRSRLDDLAALLADGLLSAAAVREQAAKLRSRLEEVERQVAAALGTSPAADLVDAEDVAAAWARLPVNTKRAVVDELAIVTLHPAGRGKAFDPESVEITWRTS